MNTVCFETIRLALRPFTRSDIDDLHRLWVDPAMRKYLWDDEVISRETTAEVIEASLESFDQYGFGFWTISFRDDPTTIGFCGLRHFTDDQGNGPDVEILYGVTARHCNRGIAREAARAVLQFAFDQAGLERVYAGADPPNQASIRVMEKIGMAFARRAMIKGLEAIYYDITAEALLLQRV
jgi:[ribosomal protein S5]-alanine N-acetyltransferase